MTAFPGSRLFGCALLLTIASCVVAPPALATLTISKKPTKAVTCSAGVCSATAKIAVLNVTDLTNMLASSNVKVVSGNKALDIDIAAPVAWASTKALTLDAYTSISFGQPLAVEGTAALTMTTDDGGTGGMLSFSGKGNVTFWDLSSSLVINGNSYILVGDIAGLAAGVKANPGGAFALAASYNAKSDGNYKTPPVTTVLAGYFEGLGNTIANLKIAVTKAHNYTGSTWKGQVGLFAGVSGTVENVGVTNAKVAGPDDTTVGTLVGELSGTVANSYSMGSVSVGNAVAGAGQPDAGGLVGGMFFSTATVSNSYSTASVSGGNSAFVGGLVGGMFSGGEIVDSYATGSAVAGNNILGGYSGSGAGGLLGIIFNDPSGTSLVIGSYASGAATTGENFTNYSGGLVGIMLGGALIELSHASGGATVGAGDSGSSAYGYAGGLVGSILPNSNGIAGSIQQSFATGSATGTSVSQVGGLVGGALGGTTISDSYSTGAASAEGTKLMAVGGFAGALQSGASVSTSYSTAAVTTTGYAGGFVGILTDGVTLTNDDWDIDTSGVTSPSQGTGNVSNAPGITGLTTVQFQSGLPAGFSGAIWAETSLVNGGLPYLLSLPPGGQALLGGLALPKPNPTIRSFTGIHPEISGPRSALKK